jgi:hypothetical protein
MADSVIGAKSAIAERGENVLESKETEPALGMDKNG